MRRRMVTRTVTFNQVNVMTVNTATATVENKGICIIGEYPEKELEKMVKLEVEKMDNCKFVAINKVLKEEQIYGMTEDEFVHYANIITR